jgi:Fur family zinc uptake transcriptional regulator
MGIQHLSVALSKQKQNIFNKAKDYCEQKGVRFTPLRARVYEILLHEDSSIGAYDLLDKLRAVEDNAKPPTVYRALDFFLDLGLVHKVESNNTFKACHHFGSSHPVQFLICDTCGDVQEIQSQGVKDTLEAQAKTHSFEIVTQTIEAHGMCKNCHGK